MDPQLKKCKQCGEEKPLDEYYQSIRAQCKPCCRSQAKIQREIKAEELRLSVERLSIAPPSYSSSSNEKSKINSNDFNVAISDKPTEGSITNDMLVKESIDETMMKRLEMLEEKIITLETIIGDLVERLANVEKFQKNVRKT
jgi:hypothetical protein